MGSSTATCQPKSIGKNMEIIGNPKKLGLPSDMI
jgi:hypothetical protein